MRALTRVAALALLALAALLAPACADEGFSLDGSLGAVYPLTADRVRARLYPSELAIEFVRESGEVPVRITVRRADGEVVRPGSVDLGRYGDVTGSLASREMPPFDGGELIFDQVGRHDGAALSGSFTARFVAGRSTYDLHGTFATRLEVVAF